VARGTQIAANVPPAGADSVSAATISAWLSPITRPCRSAPTTFDRMTALAAKLCETAYVLACDVAAADQEVTEKEARMLEMIRHRLKIDRLIAAAIEHGARARFNKA
jgi:hypothetical protein